MDSNGNETSSALQRILIGGATLIVILLTVAAAIFLAMQQSPTEPPEQPTDLPIAVVTATATATSTATATPVLIATETPMPSTTPEQQPTTEGATSTSIPPTATNTATSPPPPPTATSTEVVIIITATPRPNTPTSDPCAPPPGWVEYVVKPGDTLNSLAQKTNVGQLDLQQINCLASSVLQPGQIIYLPFSPPDPTAVNTKTATPIPTSTRRSTPTPIAPVIDQVVAVAAAASDPDQRRILVAVTGENFRPRQAGFKAELIGPLLIPLNVDLSGSSTSFEAERVVDKEVVEGLQPGVYDLIVTNPDGRSDTERAVFPRGTPTPTPPPPTIFDVSPTAGRISDEVVLTITGRDFIPRDIRVELQFSAGGFSAVELDIDEAATTSTSIRATIPPNALPQIGFYDLIVINSDNNLDLLPDAYRATS